MTQVSQVNLLHEYATRRDAEAFAKLVDQYQRLIFSTCRRKLHNSQDVDDAVQPGTNVDLAADEGHTSGGQNLQPICSCAQVADAKQAAGVARGAGVGVEGAHANARGRPAEGVDHKAPDGAHPGSVLRHRGNGADDQRHHTECSHSGRESRPRAGTHGHQAMCPPSRTSSC